MRPFRELGLDFDRWYPLPRQLLAKARFARTHRGGLLTNIDNSEITRIERASDPIRWVGVNYVIGADGDPDEWSQQFLTEIAGEEQCGE